MAEVARALHKFDYYVDYVENRLAELEEMSQSWDSQSAEDRGDFLLEWPVVEEMIAAFQRFLETYRLAPGEQKRYQQVVERIAQGRAIVDDLWKRSE